MSKSQEHLTTNAIHISAQKRGEKVLIGADNGFDIQTPVTVLEIIPVKIKIPPYEIMVDNGVLIIKKDGNNYVTVE